MTYVSITALTYPEGAEGEIEQRFAARKSAVDQAPGFESFELLRPQVGDDRYFVVTRWSTREQYQAWAAARPPVDRPADVARGMKVDVLGFDVVDLKA